MKLTCDFNRNAALPYVMRNIPIYQYPRWRHDPSIYRSWIL